MLENLLEREQSGALAQRKDVIHDQFLNALIIAELLHVLALDPQCRHCTGQHFWIGHDDSDQISFQAFAVDEHLRDVFGAYVDQLNLLRCNILALCQFEDVLK